MASVSQSQREGVFYGLSAFVLWGVMPIYFKSISHVPAFEIVAHRVIWSFVFTAVLVALMGRRQQLVTVLKNPRQLRFLVLTSLIIALNWLIFIWAVNNNHLVDASLGYFINPLVSMLLGYLFLQERMNGLQMLAVVLAMLGVSLDVFLFGSVPWVALILATSFGFYGLFRKQIRVDGLTGMLLETSVLLIPALIYLFAISESSTSDLSNNSWTLNLLLLAAGPATTIPLMAFAAATVRIQLTTVGFLQYIGPSIMFMLAVLVYGEQVTNAKWMTFLLIWSALGLFSLNALLQRRRYNSA